jgi:hypothetical protein
LGDVSEDETEYGEYKTDSIFVKSGEEPVFGGKEKRKFETYENQRAWMGMFKDVLFPHERPAWSDIDGKIKIPKESILLPVDGDWKWESNWYVEIDPNFCSKKGWQYAIDFHGPFKKSKGIIDFVRRRKWVRVASKNVSGGNNSSGLNSMVDASVL